MPGPGTFTVQIYKSEIYWTSPGKRIFSVTANGTPILTNYDIYAAVGAADPADIITASVPVTGSSLTLSFSAKVDQAKLAAIAVLGTSGGGTTTTTTAPTTTTTTTAPTGSFATADPCRGWVLCGQRGEYVAGGHRLHRWVDELDQRGDHGNVGSGVVPVGAIRDDGLHHPGAGSGYLHRADLRVRDLLDVAGEADIQRHGQRHRILTNYGIYAAVGATPPHIITASVPVTGSSLTLSFSAKVDQAKLAAIVVLGTSGGGTTTTTTTTAPTGSFALRIHAGGGSYVDSAGNTWLADTDYTGGSTNSTSAAITGTSDQALFQSERFGMTACTIPVPGPGTYTVQIYESEIYWTSPGKRIFSVTANGTPILTNYDIYAAVGANAADIITASVPVTGSSLTLSFSAKVDQAKLAAIAVLGTSMSWKVP